MSKTLTLETPNKVFIKFQASGLFMLLFCPITLIKSFYKSNEPRHSKNSVIRIKLVSNIYKIS